MRVFWNINYFSLDFIKNSASASVIDSHSFEMDIGRNKTKWFLRIYPNGDEKRKSCIGIHLVKKSEYVNNYEYSCRFVIMKNEKEVLSKQFKARPSENESIGEGYGFMLFLSHGELFQWFDKFVDGSDVTIRADIELSTAKTGDERGVSKEKVLRDVHISSIV